MKVRGSPEVMGVSVMRREVTARWRATSGRSRNWSVQFSLFAVGDGDGASLLGSLGCRDASS